MARGNSRERHPPPRGHNPALSPRRLIGAPLLLQAASLLARRGALLGGDGFGAPPSFIVASTVDTCTLPKEHTDIYVGALKARAIRHVYVRRNFGEHGFALNGGWSDRAIKWLRSEGFGGQKKGRRNDNEAAASASAAGVATCCRPSLAPRVAGGSTPAVVAERAAENAAEVSPTTASTVST